VKDTVLNFVQMKNYIIIIFVSSFFITACNGQKKNYMTERQKNLSNEYFDAKKKFDKKYTSHFPNVVVVDSLFSLGTDSENKTLMLGGTITDIESIDDLIKQAKAVYNSSDSCQLIINRFEADQYYDLTKLSDSDKSLIDRPCYKDKLPIPIFQNIQYADNYTGRLFSDFTLYVLDAEPGMFYKPNDKYEPDNYMPEYWEHGYSKGFAVNESKDIAVYWIVIW
jgi:hypothetical protein